MVYADWSASGRLYQPIEDRLLREVAPWMANTYTETSATGQAISLAYARARSIIKCHLNASADDVLVATGTGCTGAINKLQHMLGLRVPSNYIGHASVFPGRRALVLVTQVGHHSNQTSWLSAGPTWK
jgi:selenocysteine lyase/cysteine desulfurase